MNADREPGRGGGAHHGLPARPGADVVSFAAGAVAQAVVGCCLTDDPVH
jgi:hypothetical protein